MLRAFRARDSARQPAHQHHQQVHMLKLPLPQFLMATTTTLTGLPASRRWTRSWKKATRRNWFRADRRIASHSGAASAHLSCLH
eukprot:2846590-Pleurochrysis_carterae.AAC.1